MRSKIPEDDGHLATPELGTDGAVPPELSEPVAHARRVLKIALAGSLAIVVTLAVFTTFLLTYALEANSQAASPPSATPTESAIVEVTASWGPTAEPEGDNAPQEPQAAPAPPAPPAPAPAPPAPPAPPTLPDPPAPIVPLAITNMNATVTGACTTDSWIKLTWTTTGADAYSANINLRSGGGTPIFNENWPGYDASGSWNFHVDCTRPLWFFTLTVSHGGQTKSGLLTFANGSTSGWSPNGP